MPTKEELLQAWRSSQNQVIAVGVGGLQGELQCEADLMCTACFNGPQAFIFACGHKVCRDCARSLAKCHDCGRMVSGRARAIAAGRTDSGSATIRQAEKMSRLKTGSYAAQAAQAHAEATAADQIPAGTPKVQDPSTAMAMELFSSDKHIHIPMCEICHKKPVSVELGCSHKTCTGCSNRLHACVLCGKLIVHRTLLTNKYRSVFDFTTTHYPQVRKAVSGPSGHHSPALLDAAGSDSGAGVCAICNERPKTLVLQCDGGCAHQTCGPCLSDIRDCIGCGRGIKTIVALKDTLFGDTQAAAADAHQVDGGKPRDRMCQICENRPRAAVMHCKSGCEVDSCGPCTARHRKCFKCERKIKDITMTKQDTTGAAGGFNGCDTCHLNGRTHLLRCRMGCRFRVCAGCTKTMKKCCGTPVQIVGKISSSGDGGEVDGEKGVLTDGKNVAVTAASGLGSPLGAASGPGPGPGPGPTTMSSPKKSAKVTRKLFEYDENDPGSESTYTEYQCKMREREAIEMRIPPIRTTGGFMGY